MNPPDGDLLLRTIPLGIGIVNEDGRFLFFNEALERLVDKDCLGKTCWEVCMDNGLQGVDCPLRRPIEIGGTRTIEFCGMLGGRTFCISHTGMKYQGRYAVLQVFREIIEPRPVSRTLLESAEALSRLANAAFEGIVIHEQGTILEVNRAILDMFGYPQEQIIGQSVLVFVHPEFRDLVRDHIRSSFEQPYEAVGLKKGGVRMDLQVRGCDIVYRGRLARVAALNDITQHKLA